MGRSVALAYAGEGADVAIVARTLSEPEAVGSEIRALGRRAHTVNAELTISEGASPAARETVSESEARVDVLGCDLGPAETGACSATSAGEAKTATRSGSSCHAGWGSGGGLSGDQIAVPG